MKKLILLSTSVIALGAAVPAVPVDAQNNVQAISVTPELRQQAQTAYEQALATFQSRYAGASVTDIDLHLHQETNQFVVRILGEDQTTEYQLISYNGEDFFASKAKDDNSVDEVIDTAKLTDLASAIEKAIKEAGTDRLVDISLDGKDDDGDDRLEWEFTFVEGDEKITVEIDAETGEVLEVERDSVDDIDDDDDDRHFYRQFYSDYRGKRPTVRDKNYSMRRRDDDIYDDIDDRDDWDDDWDDDYDDYDDYYDDDWDDYDDYDDYYDDDWDDYYDYDDDWDDYDDYDDDWDDDWDD